MAEQRDATFNFNKYGDPDLLDLKETVAQAIINALFMVPGNLPSLPHIGVNIKQYLYRSDIDSVTSEIESGLKEACGKIVLGVFINSVDVSIQKTSFGESIYLIMVRLTFPDMKDDSILGVSVKENNNLVKFNYAYANDLK